MQVYVRIKSLNKSRKTELVPYDLPEGIRTVRGLIEAFVRLELERFNRQDGETMLLSLMSGENISDQARAGRVSFGRRGKGKSVEPEGAVNTALTAFQDGLFRILMGERELTDPDESISVEEQAVFSFIKLTFLAGRMW